MVVGHNGRNGLHALEPVRKAWNLDTGTAAALLLFAEESSVEGSHKIISHALNRLSAVS